METRSSPVNHAVVDQELLQLSATSKKAMSSSDKTEGIQLREITAQLGVGHHAIQEMMEILGYQKVCSCEKRPKKKAV
jgi:hypothetical protein